MAPDVRATGDVSSIVGNYYDKLMLERLIQGTVLYPLAEKRPIPKGTGTTINMNRFTNFPITVTPLTEGEVPTQQYLSGTAVTATLFQLGNWTPVSDLLELTAFSDVVKECVENMGDSAALSVDGSIFLKCLSEAAGENPSSAQTISTWFYGLQGGLSTYYMSADGLIISAFGGLYSTLSAATADDGHTLDLDKISRVAARLAANNVKPFEDGYYKLLTHPKCTANIRRSAEWASWNAYTRPGVLDKGLVGVAHGVKIYESTVSLNHSVVARTSAPWAAGISGVWNIMWGKGMLGVTELAGEKGPKITVKAPNQYDTSNPLNQWSTIGWKVTMAAKVLNHSCGQAFLTLVN